jgi:hypothetical protein
MNKILIIIFSPLRIRAGAERAGEEQEGEAGGHLLLLPEDGGRAPPLQHTEGHRRVLRGREDLPRHLQSTAQGGLHQG